MILCYMLMYARMYCILSHISYIYIYYIYISIFVSTRPQWSYHLYRNVKSNHTKPIQNLYPAPSWQGEEPWIWTEGGVPPPHTRSLAQKGCWPVACTSQTPKLLMLDQLDVDPPKDASSEIIGLIHLHKSPAFAVGVGDSMRMILMILMIMMMRRRRRVLSLSLSPSLSLTSS